jgi:ParB family chromosome partitioning protein
VASRRTGLGRGLESLIPGVGAEQGGATTTVDIDSIEPNPLQPRTLWDDAALEALAASIREHGIIQPIIVSRRGVDKPYQIIAGERRWRAARRAGLTSAPILVREATALEVLELALVENIQRADLNPLEEALAFKHLMDEFELSQAQIAERVGRSRPAIANTIRLLTAPEAIRDAVANETISAGHARALMSVPDPRQQAELLQRVVSRKLSVRQTEQLAQASGAAPRAKPPADPRRRDAAIDAVSDSLRRHLGAKVDVQHGPSGGRIVIHYASDEELNGILNRIVGDDEDA